MESRDAIIFGAGTSGMCAASLCIYPGDQLLLTPADIGFSIKPQGCAVYISPGIPFRPGVAGLMRQFAPV